VTEVADAVPAALTTHLLAAAPLTCARAVGCSAAATRRWVTQATGEVRVPVGTLPGVVLS
jgi:hypothetical protein